MAKELILEESNSKIYLDNITIYHKFMAIDSNNECIAIIAYNGKEWNAIIINDEVVFQKKLKDLLQYFKLDDCRFYEIT